MNLKKINITLFVILFVIVAALALYRILHPIPLLEEQACKRRMSKIALLNQLYYRKNHLYTNDLKKLAQDNKKHFYMQCPQSNQEYILKTNKDTFLIICPYHKKIIKNGVFIK